MEEYKQKLQLAFAGLAKDDADENIDSNVACTEEGEKEEDDTKEPEAASKDVDAAKDEGGSSLISESAIDEKLTPIIGKKTVTQLMPLIKNKYTEKYVTKLNNVLFKSEKGDET